MNEEDELIPAKKKSKIKTIIIVLLVVSVMSGAGIAGGLYAAGAFGHADEAPKEDSNRPRLVLKGEDPAAIAGQVSGESSGSDGESGSKRALGANPRLPRGGVDLPAPKDVSKYQATYFQMPAPYTSNLADTDSLVQISLAVSTYYDARVIEAVKTHEMAMRSEILMLLAQEHEMVIAMPEGKVGLQKKLTKLINGILKEKSGYSGIDNVYFTNFVIQ